MTMERNNFAFIIPRPYGSMAEKKHHIMDCMSGAVRRGWIPVLDEEMSSYILKDLKVTIETIPIFFAVGKPLEKCRVCLVYTQANTPVVHDAIRRASAANVIVIDCINQRDKYDYGATGFLE